MAAEAVSPQSSRKCELTNLTKSCILHPLNIMLKRDKPHWEQLQKFCSELYSKVSQVKTDKRSQQMPAAVDSLKDSLQISVDEFEKGSLTTMDISLEIERKLVESLSIKEGHNDFDYDSLFRVCWKAYRVEKRNIPIAMMTACTTYGLSSTLFSHPVNQTRLEYQSNV